MKRNIELRIHVDAEIDGDPDLMDELIRQSLHLDVGTYHKGGRWAQVRFTAVQEIEQKVL